MKKITTSEFKDRAFLIHKGKYSYDKTDLEHRDSMGKVMITCPIHGDFIQTPKNHLHGQGCPKCNHKSTKYTVDEIKEKIIEKYGDKYDVSLITEYRKNTQKLPLVCKEHGYFEATWNDLDNNHGCQVCGKIRNYEPLRKTKETFIKESLEIHGDKYDYSLLEYNNAFTNVLIKCKKCGLVFTITPHDHLKGKGCPRCNESHLENEVREFLDVNGIKHIDRCDKKYFDWLGRQHLDFYLPQYNVAIECQGGQHFRNVDFFGSENGFNYRFMLDNRKKSLCNEHNIKILYFTHENYDSFLNEKTIKNTEKLLEEINHNGANVDG
jgi:Zn finger protein HypA/HybF involved in hydrogenase expression